MAVKGKAGKQKRGTKRKDTTEATASVEEADTPQTREEAAPPQVEAKDISDPEEACDVTDKEEAEEEEIEEPGEADESADVEESIVPHLPAAVPAEAKGKKRKSKTHRLADAMARADAEEGGTGSASEYIPRGVLYLGHIPLGFAEPQMRKYFNQFGTVLRLRLSRSKKSTESKGYAFIEFEEEAVAKIVAETMNGYMLFDKKLVCHLMDKDKIHPNLFKGWNRPMINFSNRRRIQQRSNYNDRPTVEVEGERIARTTRQQVRRRDKSHEKLKELLQSLEVDYDLSEFPAPALAKISPKIKETTSPKIKPAENRTVTATSPTVGGTDNLEAKSVDSPKTKEAQDVEAESTSANTTSKQEDPAAPRTKKGKKRRSSAAASA